ncbi:NUDIX hydrolase [Lysobacter sp. TY2-98]|uniref:NUDIX hydrolase n=1 Tax=Lysobacter sp. TY2-98 TaxID=2290922 RepID=UPI000E1FB877|nr:NUDIX hydrolase [Lysobacter sp. TY2-98]AXK72223.1 NUDIX hydrolase [Lysobacter sp. TY2-98]
MDASTDHHAAIARLHDDLADYARRWPDEAHVVAHFVELLHDLESAPFARERLAGHFTGSAWLVDRSGARVLLTHHRKLGRWLQLGGHADGDVELGRVALKEAEEESGLGGLRLEPGLFDLDRHWLPERGDVPAHWHYDVRFVVRAGEDEAFVVSEESLDLAWRDVRELLADPATDESVERMSRKWLIRDGA